MALLETPSTNKHGPIKPDEAKEVLQTGTWGDAAALKLVVQDAVRAENFEAAKQSSESLLF